MGWKAVYSHMVRCLDCKTTTSNPKAENWGKHQMCYKCARKNFPEDYKDKPDHGVGGSRMNLMPNPISLMESFQCDVFQK